jgi:hypothetical protein
MLLATTGALMPSPVAHLTSHFAFFRDEGFLTPLILWLFSPQAQCTNELRSISVFGKLL